MCVSVARVYEGINQLLHIVAPGLIRSNQASSVKSPDRRQRGQQDGRHQADLHTNNAASKTDFASPGHLQLHYDVGIIVRPLAG